MKKSQIKWWRIVGLSVWVGIGLIQLAYALCWAWQNGSNIQDFYDSEKFIQSALHLTCDGWRLAGYSCIIRFFMRFENLLGPGYIVLLYLFQATCTLFCFAEGVRCIRKCFDGYVLPFGWAVAIAGYLVTLPVIWQMQFAVLPDALSLSLVVLAVSKMIEVFLDKESHNFYAKLTIAGSVICIGLLERHYFFGMICFLFLNGIVLLAHGIWKKDGRQRKLTFGWILLCMAIVIPFLVEAVNRSVPTVKEYTPYSIQAELIPRFVYPNIKEDYEYYPDAVKEVLPEQLAYRRSEYLELYFEEIGATMAERCTGDVSMLYLDMAKTGFSLHRGEIIKGTVKECILYAMTPFSLLKNMYSNGNSLYGHNYTKMYEMSPKLTADYMHLGINGLLIVIILGSIIGLAEFIFSKKIRKQRGKIFLYAAGCAFCITMPMILLSIMRFDYRNGLFILFLWALFAVTYISRFCCKKSWNRELYLNE